jgi:hypothetical protein
MLKLDIRGESEKQKCSATEMLMSAVTITTPSGPLCMRGVPQIIVEEEMDHPLIGRPVLDEMGFVESQYLDSVRDKFHLHDFSHIGERYELLRMRALSISYAEGFLVISCGKVDYDKSGWRSDWRKMWQLCVTESRIRRCETRSRRSG